MPDNIITVKEDVFGRFFPLNIINQKFHDELLAKSLLTSFEENKTIVKRSSHCSLKHYLLDGEVEIRYSFDNRKTLSCLDEQSKFPLEENLKTESGSIRAINRCEILVVNADYIDELLSRSQSKDYGIVHLNADSSMLDLPIIDDELKENWEEVFVTSSLGCGLRANVLFRLFSNMEEVQANENEVVIKIHSPGDYFYIVKQGYAMVITESSGAFAGEQFELGIGDYFGDEALVADTQRNATVVMTSDGILMRLNKENFIDIIKSELVQNISAEQAIQTDSPQYIDVRFPLEYRHGHRDNCINIPISVLRKNIQSIERSNTYIVLPAGGRRSELATYIMKQAGLTAYHLIDEEERGIQIDQVSQT